MLPARKRAARTHLTYDILGESGCVNAPSNTIDSASRILLGRSGMETRTHTKPPRAKRAKRALPPPPPPPPSPAQEARAADGPEADTSPLARYERYAGAANAWLVTETTSLPFAWTREPADPAPHGACVTLEIVASAHSRAAAVALCVKCRDADARFGPAGGARHPPFAAELPLEAVVLDVCPRDARRGEPRCAV